MTFEELGVNVGKICLSSSGWFFTLGGGLAGAKPETQRIATFMVVTGLGLIIAGAFL